MDQTWPAKDRESTAVNPGGLEDRVPPAPYFLRVSEMLAITLLAMSFMILSRWPLWHSDVWGHLKFGQWIVQQGALPAHEPFSPFSDRQTCISFQWLFQVLMVECFTAGERLAGGDELRRLAGGVEMLTLLFAVLLLLRSVFLLLAYRRVSGSLPLACLALLLTGSLFGRPQRPQFAGEALFALVLLALSRPILSRCALLLVPACFVLWANLHGSYAVGLALVGVFFLGRVFEACRTSSGRRLETMFRDAQVRRLFVLGLASTAAVAVFNPHGPWLLLATARFSQHPNIASMVEWQPLHFRWTAGPHWSYGLGWIVVVLTQILRVCLINSSLPPKAGVRGEKARAKPAPLTPTPLPPRGGEGLVGPSPGGRLLSPTRLLLCATFGLLPLWQQRMNSWWIALVPWIVLPVWAEMGRRLPWAWVHYQSEASATKTFLAGILLLLALWLSAPLQWLRSHQPRPLERSLSPGTPWQLAAQLQAANDTHYYPKLAEILRRNYPESRFEGRIFATETQGDYLLWALPSDYPVLVYSHAHLFPPDHWQNHLTIKSAGPGWREFLDRFGVNLAILEVEDHPQLANALRADAEWQIVLDEAGLPQKRDPRTRLFIVVRKKPLAVTPTG